jgi:hypothetical protein
MLQQIAFAIVIAVGDHGAVQAQHHTIERQRGAQLPQHLVTQFLKGLARHQAGRLGPGTGTFDQGPTLGSGATPGYPKWRGAQLGVLGVLAGRRIKGLMEAFQRRGDRRKCVGFSTDGRGKQAHGGSPLWVAQAVLRHSDRFPKHRSQVGTGGSQAFTSSGFASKYVANYPLLTKL